MHQGWMGHSALELGGDLGQDLPPLQLRWWLLGHGALALAPSLCQLCSALGVVPHGGVSLHEGMCPKAGVTLVLLRGTGEQGCQLPGTQSSGGSAMGNILSPFL